MKKFYAFLFLSYAFASFPSQVAAYDTNNRHGTELQSIDQEMASLEEKLAAMRKKQVSSEIHAQTYMIDEWHEFAENIQAAEESEKNIFAIKKKIEELKERKQTLIKHSASK